MFPSLISLQINISIFSLQNIIIIHFNNRKKTKVIIILVVFNDNTMSTSVQIIYKKKSNVLYSINSIIREVVNWKLCF